MCTFQSQAEFVFRYICSIPASLCSLQSFSAISHHQTTSGMWRLFRFQLLALVGLMVTDISSSFADASQAPKSHTMLLAEAQEPHILGSRIHGEIAVQKFRSHVACFSESGEWQWDNTPRLIPWNVAGDPFANQCDNRHLKTPGNVAYQKADDIARHGGNWTVREELKWIWHSNVSCPMLAFNRTELCKRIGSKKNILIVGDSINHELQWVFLNHFMDPQQSSRSLRSLSSVRLWQGENVCAESPSELGSGFRVGWIRNDRLSRIEHENADSIGNFYEWPWLKYLEQWDIQILLLNRGAHYEADGVFVRTLRDTFALLQAQYPQLLVFYRNTPPGHVNCTIYSHPIPGEQSQDSRTVWHWGDFQRQNLLAKRIVEEAGYIYMDIDSMISLRPDGHIGSQDCLHYCLPGPLDVIMHLFYNIYLLL